MNRIEVLESSHPVTMKRPGVLRRSVLVVTGVLACLLPVVWTVNLSRMLLVGELSDHRFHQLTGQGLLLTTLWLAGLVPMLRAGWAGRRPSTAAGLMHLTYVGTGIACAAAATGGGAPILMVIIAVTSALVWLALPVRPTLRTAIQPDPVLAPLALVAAAVHTPYILDQIALQNAATGHHAQNPHFFDMAWLVLALALLGVLGSLLPAARRLVAWAGAGTAYVGLAGVLLAEDRPWTGAALAVGCALLAGLAATGHWSSRGTNRVRTTAA